MNFRNYKRLAFHLVYCVSGAVFYFLIFVAILAQCL